MGVLASIQHRLRAFAREQEGHRSRPTAAILDSQTVRSNGLAAEADYDAAKKTKDRKRFIIVDPFGHLLAILVTPADRQERDGAKELLDEALEHHGGPRKLWVDGGYSDETFARHVEQLQPNPDVKVVKRSNKAPGFEVVPKRWVVERTSCWLMQRRRLTRDSERTVQKLHRLDSCGNDRIMLRGHP